MQTEILTPGFLFIYLLFILLIYFWLHWVFWVFIAAGELSLVAEHGATLIVVHGLLIAVASLVAEHGL